MPQFLRVLSILCLFFACPFVQDIKSQPTNAIYASSQTNDASAIGVGANARVDNPDFAKNTSSNVKPNSNAATLIANPGIGSASAWLQLEFPTEITSNADAPVSVYIRTGDIPTSLLTGVTVTAYNAGGSVVSLLSPGLKTFYTPDGGIYLSVTPNGSFKSVRTTISTLLAGAISLQVFYAFHNPTASNSTNPYPFNAADCGKPTASTKGSSGLNLGTFDVINAGKAIDDGLDTKSSFVSTGASLLSGHIKQTFLFSGRSTKYDAVRVILSQSASFVGVNVGKSIKLQAFDGSQSVGTATLVNQIVSADVLGLLTTPNNTLTFYFAPKDANGSVKFDRLELDLDIGLLGVALGSNGINIHDVRRAPDMPQAANARVCSNVGSILLSALAQQVNESGVGSFIYKWFNASGTQTSTDQNYTASGLNTVGQATYYVETQKTGSGCIVSPRKEVSVSIVLPPANPGVALNP